MAKKNDSLGDRMKGYEGVSRNFLTRRVPAIIRLDGKAFHTFTKGMEKPFDLVLTQAMQETIWTVWNSGLGEMSQADYFAHLVYGLIITPFRCG